MVIGQHETQIRHILQAMALRHDLRDERWNYQSPTKFPACETKLHEMRELFLQMLHLEVDYIVILSSAKIEQLLTVLQKQNRIHAI